MEFEQHEVRRRSHPKAALVISRANHMRADKASVHELSLSIKNHISH